MDLVCAFNSMGEEYSECIVMKETGNIQSNLMATSDRVAVMSAKVKSQLPNLTHPTYNREKA